MSIENWGFVLSIRMFGLYWHQMHISCYIFTLCLMFLHVITCKLHYIWVVLLIYRSDKSWNPWNMRFSHFIFIHKKIQLKWNIFFPNMNRTVRANIRKWSFYERKHDSLRLMDVPYFTTNTPPGFFVRTGVDIVIWPWVF